MDSFNDVFEAAKEYCHEHTAEATYQCYISGLEPVSFENSNCVTLLVRATILSARSFRTVTRRC